MEESVNEPRNDYLAAIAMVRMLHREGETSTKCYGAHLGLGCATDQMERCSQWAQRHHLRAHSQASGGLSQLTQLQMQAAITIRRTVHVAGVLV